jgi:site-specific recombinase XerD
VRFDVAIDRYVEDQWAEGRFNSASTERNYRGVLVAHLKDIGNRDPRYTNREDVKATLRRWRHPNSRRKNRSILKAFYTWTVQEGLRKDNPVEQTRPTKHRAPETRRLTKDEIVRLLETAQTERDQFALFLGFFTGLRNAELRGLQGMHFARTGLIEVPSKSAKGKKARTVPVAPELEPIVVVFGAKSA